MRRCWENRKNTGQESCIPSPVLCLDQRRSQPSSVTSQWQPQGPLSLFSPCSSFRSLHRWFLSSPSSWLKYHIFLEVFPRPLINSNPPSPLLSSPLTYFMFFHSTDHYLKLHPLFCCQFVPWLTPLLVTSVIVFMVTAGT